MRQRSERSSAALRHSGSPRRALAETPASPAMLPEPFRGWFSMRGWQPRPHQLRLIEQAAARRPTLLIAPTGAGKTLAGFLPSLVALAAGKRPRRGAGLHTLYISPLKALATDVARNLLTPVDEMSLPVRIETRTGDTPVTPPERQ